jgi:hypothetical protein
MKRNTHDFVPDEYLEIESSAVSVITRPLLRLNLARRESF